MFSLFSLSGVLGSTSALGALAVIKQSRKHLSFNSQSSWFIYYRTQRLLMFDWITSEEIFKNLKSFEHIIKFNLHWVAANDGFWFGSKQFKSSSVIKKHFSPKHPGVSLPVSCLDLGRDRFIPKPLSFVSLKKWYQLMDAWDWRVIFTGERQTGGRGERRKERKRTFWKKPQGWGLKVENVPEGQG